MKFVSILLQKAALDELFSESCHLSLCGRLVWKVRISNILSEKVCIVLCSYWEAGLVHLETDRVEYELCFERALDIAGHVLVVDGADELWQEVSS